MRRGAVSPQAVALADLADPLNFSASGSTLAESAQAVLRQAPPHFALAGTSAGGDLALEIVASAPARVAGLWLMGANPGASADPDGARRLIAREDRWSALSLLAVPTLLLWGRHDQFASVERASELAARVSSARLVVLEDCGHLPTLEHADACDRAARDWLERVSAG